MSEEGGKFVRRLEHRDVDEHQLVPPICKKILYGRTSVGVVVVVLILNLCALVLRQRVSLASDSVEVLVDELLGDPSVVWSLQHALV